MELVIMLAGLIGQAGDSAAPADESRWTVLAREHVDGYTLAPADTKSAATYTRIEKPVSQHDQNVTGTGLGSVYVWTDQTGRPVAICDVFFLKSQGTYHLSDEWHSLTAESMVARRDNGIRWAPSEPGLTWTEIPDAPIPSDTSERRLLQLRQLSRRFSGHIFDRSKKRYELRMLTTPICRYDTVGSTDSLGGGVFAFCQANDPEMLLVVEARKSGDGYRWMYAPAEYSNMDQYLVLDGNEVWTAAPPTFSVRGRHMGGPIRAVEIGLEDR